MKENTVIGDNQLWTSIAAPIAYLFQNKVMSLLRILLIYDEPLSSTRK